MSKLTPRSTSCRSSATSSSDTSARSSHSGKYMGRLQLVPASTSLADGMTNVFVKSGWRRLARKSTFAPMAAWNAAMRRMTGRGVHDMSGWLTSNWVSGCNFIFESSFGMRSGRAGASLLFSSSAQPHRRASFLLRVGSAAWRRCTSLSARQQDRVGMSEAELTFDFVTERRWHWTHAPPIESKASTIRIVAVGVGDQVGVLLEVDPQLQGSIGEHLSPTAEDQGHVVGCRAAHGVAGFDDQGRAAGLAHCLHELRVVQEADIRNKDEVTRGRIQPGPQGGRK